MQMGFAKAVAFHCLLLVAFVMLNEKMNGWWFCCGINAKDSFFY